MSQRENNTGNRIGLFCLGAAIASIFGTLAWLGFMLSTMQSNPAADANGIEVRQRAADDSLYSVPFIGLILGTCLGIAFMLVAILKRNSSQNTTLIADTPEAP